MRIGKNPANASNICRSDRNATLHFRLRHTGIGGSKYRSPLLESKKMGEFLLLVLLDLICSTL